MALGSRVLVLGLGLVWLWGLGFGMGLPLLLLRLLHLLQQRQQQQLLLITTSPDLLLLQYHCTTTVLLLSASCSSGSFCCCACCYAPPTSVARQLSFSPGLRASRRRPDLLHHHQLFYDLECRHWQLVCKRSWVLQKLKDPHTNGPYMEPQIVEIRFEGALYTRLF